MSQGVSGHGLWPQTQSGYLNLSLWSLEAGQHLRCSVFYWFMRLLREVRTCSQRIGHVMIQYILRKRRLGPFLLILLTLQTIGVVRAKRLHITLRAM